MKDKFQLIIVPFLIVIFGLTGLYTFLHWLLFIRFEVFSLKEMITSFAIPGVLTGLAVLFFLRPRLKLLNLRSKRGNWIDFYSFMLWIILSIPMLVAQAYIVTATGKLMQLKAISEIEQKEKSKYYTVDNYYVDKYKMGNHSSFEVSGKNNQHFNMHIYISLPIFDAIGDTSRSKCFAWLGIEYSKQISNRLEQDEKEAEYLEFAKQSQEDFDNKNVQKFIYLNRIGNSDERDGFIEAIKSNPKFEPNEVILEPINEPFNARNGSKLEWLLGSTAVGSIIWFVMILIPQIDVHQLDRIKKGRPDRKRQKEIKEFINFAKPKEGFFITPLLIYINVGVFLLMVVMGLGFISFKGSDLLLWGANYGPSTRSGEWWRLLTSTFLHGGLMHILANMYGLLFVGIFLEPVLGKGKYLMIYLLTGVLASCASLWWYEATVSVGASGAIFGVYGVFLALLVTKIFPPDFGKAFLTSTLIFVGFNLLMGFAGGIDNAAHIGGLLSGFIIGLLLYPSLKEQIEIDKRIE